MSQLSIEIFPTGSNDTPLDFLTNDHFRVLNMTFIHVIMIICYGLDLFNHTVTWYRIFWKIEADDGLLWIDSSIISRNPSCCCPEIPEQMKKCLMWWDLQNLTQVCLCLSHDTIHQKYPCYKCFFWKCPYTVYSSHYQGLYLKTKSSVIVSFFSWENDVDI